jgi:transcriptional regulator with GAF, ATPase, and Fis domain
MESKKAQLHHQALGVNTQFETLLADLSTIFSDAHADEIDDEIRSALEEIGAFLHVDCSFLGEITEDRQSTFWCWGAGALGHGVLPELLQAQHSWLTARMAAKEPLVLSLPHELPERFQRGGLQSVVAVPASVGGEVVAWLGLATARPRTWPKGLLRRLRHLGEIFANALHRRRLESRLSARVEAETEPEGASAPWLPSAAPGPIVFVLGESTHAQELISRALCDPELRREASQRVLALPDGSEIGSRAPTTLESMERAHILRVLEDAQWKINGRGNAAERLGLKPSTLRFRMKKLGIVRPPPA